MRSAATLVFAALAAAAPAPADIEKRQAINDGVILNYALTLENLENAFYMQGLQQISEEDFTKATGNKGFYNNLKEISKDEMTHVQFLTTALQGANVTPVKPCTYNFGFKDATSFLAIANVLEGVGVSAYLGAAQFIMNKSYLTAAASILTVEARHSAYLRDNQKPAMSPFPAPFDIPLDFDQVYSLAAQFIVKCPPSNPTLPVMAFPAITVSPAGTAKPGDKLTFTVAKSVSAKAAWFITSMGPVSAQLSGSGTKYTVVVPSGAQPGQEYVVLTKDSNKPTDDNTVAGPAIVQVADNDYGKNYWHGWDGEGKGYGNKEAKGY